MSKMMKAVYMAGAIIGLSLLTACAPEVGTEAWCSDMGEKPKGDWTSNEAGDYAKHCIFK